MALIDENDPKLAGVIPQGEMNSSYPLRCAVCGDGFLHQERVTVVFRPKDAARASAVTVDPEGARLHEAERLAGNHNHLELVLWCETCDKHSVLYVVHYDGSTFAFLSPVSPQKGKQP